MFDYVERRHPGDLSLDHPSRSPKEIELGKRRADVLRYRPHLDGIRALAVLSVITFHAFPQFAPGGFVGVSVFFVISGYLISSIILKELGRQEFSVAEFYRRRVLRIFPALAVVLATCLGLGYFVLLPDEFANLGKNVVAASGFAANLAFWREAGYFAPSSAFQPTLHLWSLGIEEQFYLFWPLCLILAWKRGWNLMKVTAATTLASFAVSVIALRVSPHAAFYLPLARFWELGLGCALAALHRSTTGEYRRRRDVDALTGWLPWLGLAMIASAIYTFDRDTPFPGIAALLPTVGAVCLIAAPEQGWFARKVLAHRAMVFVGLISYPLYLWHWPLLSFASILHAGTPGPAVCGVALGVSFVLAYLTFRYVERPFRTHRNRASVFSLLGSVATIGILGFVVFHEAGFASRFGDDLVAVQPRPKTTKMCVSSVSLPRVYNYCLRSNAHPPEAVFLGDSQGQGVYEGVVDTLGHAYPLLLLGRGGCPPGLNVPAASREVYDSPGDREDCNEAWSEFVRFVHETKPKMVVLVGDGSRFFLPPQPGRASTPALANQDARAFEVGLSNLIETLPQMTRAVYLQETPTFQTMPTCFLRRFRLPWDSCVPEVSRREVEAERAGYESAVKRIQASHPALRVVNAIPALCERDVCQQRTPDGVLLYRDRMHLTRAGGSRLSLRSGLADMVKEGISGE